MKTVLLLSIVATLSLPAAGLPVIAVSETISETNHVPSLERQAQLQEILAENCTVCHGSRLRGKVGPPLTAKALASKNEQTLVNTILEGRPGTVMPSWEFMLKESDARWLVKYLRSSE